MTFRKRDVLVLLLPLVLYAAALNPYFLPDQYDNVVYYFGARSLIETGTYQFDGKYVVDWPPVTSLLLAVPQFVGVRSVWAAKYMILACVCVGLMLVFRLCVHQQRPRPLLVCVCFALLPVGFLMGTRLMSEWPFVATSFLFLNLLDVQNRGRRGFGFAFLTGLALGAAALTRYAGVLLGAAVVAQAVMRLKGRGNTGLVPAVLPEGIVALTGAGMFGLWKWKLARQIAAGTAEHGNWGNWGFLSAEYIHPLKHSPLDVVDTMNDLFYRSGSLVEYLHIQNPVLLVVMSLPALVAVYGLVLQVRSGKVTPADWYVMITLLLFSVAKWKLTRHWLPLAPFLIGYLFVGFDALCRQASDRVGVSFRWAFRGVVTVWVMGLVFLNGYLLWFGNVNDTHRGLCVMASPSADQFYAGYWRDLYRICQIVKADPLSESVAIVGEVGGIGKYVMAFSGRDFVPFSADHSPSKYVLVRKSSPISDAVKAQYGLEEVYLSQHLTLLSFQRQMMMSQMRKLKG